MKERETNTAKRFDILEKMQALENDILKIDCISSVEFDIDGFYSNIFYVILIPKYEISVTLPNYFEERKKQLQTILDVCKKHDLSPSGDSIEDYGEHWYIVRRCGNTWRKKNLEKEQ